MQPDLSLPSLAADYRRAATAWEREAAEHRRISGDATQKEGTRLIAEQLADRADRVAADWSALAHLAQAVTGAPDEGMAVAACRLLAARVEGCSAA